MSEVVLRLGDCRVLMGEMDEASVDAIVTDPPYGLEFMGKGWDAPWKATSGGFASPGIGERKTAWPSFRGSNLSRCETCGLLIGQGGSPCVCESPKPKRQDSERMRVFQEWCMTWAVEALRVLKPGGHLVSFGGTRTYHRITCALEDAGFEIRDCLMWLYGQGFPKSLDVSKAIDKAAGAEREVIGPSSRHSGKTRASAPIGDLARYGAAGDVLTAPATDAAREWTGWGTALKPAWEPIILARKPLIGTVAANVQKHGTGAVNIDGCRIAGANPPIARRQGSTSHLSTRSAAEAQAEGKMESRTSPETFRAERAGELLGRWPANVVLDEEAGAILDEQSGDRSSPWIGNSNRGKKGGKMFGGVDNPEMSKPEYRDAGGASRFFYCAKTSSSERHAAGENKHPTVKPVALMRWLVRLVTPPGGLVLDPFCGSGSTGVAAREEGFEFLGLEQDPSYIEIARKRCEGK